MPNLSRITLAQLLLGTLVLLLSLQSISANRRNQKNGVGHQAHARPGGAYLQVDWDRLGHVKVTLDASDSHTHFVDPDDPTPGFIVSYEWFNLSTGLRLSKSSHPLFTTTFYLGVTKIKLAVTDNAGDVSEASTYVRVRRPFLHEIRRPVLNAIEPANGPTSGGAYITVRGAAFYNSPVVHFGSKRIRPTVHSESEMTFLAPAVPHACVIRVSVKTGFGLSEKMLKFHYQRSPENPVRFRDTLVLNDKKKPFRIPMMTSIKLGPDGRYIIGTRGGHIYAVRVDRSFTVRAFCKSSSVGPDRSVLGLAFDPAEPSPDHGHANSIFSIYVSTSRLMDNNPGLDWDNGRVEVWKTQPKKECIIYVRTLISGLPVSTRDHAVTALVFHPDGRLLVAVGSNTNAGVIKRGKDMFNLPETPLSGAVLAFPFRKPWFDGNITYTSKKNPGKTRKASGTVYVFASGIRSALGMTIHSNGHVYALDNGPNVGYGVAAVGCGRKGNQVQFVDKLLDVRRGAYYGHPNWNRGRNDKRQCKFIRGDTEDMGRRYSAAMMSVESSTNGIVEYTANRFDGALMGQLILSQLAWEAAGDVTAVEINKRGTGVVDMRQLHDDSGIAVEIGPYGELLIPSYVKGTILVLAPVEKYVPRLRVIAVNPRRGRLIGGNFVTITGNGFKRGDKIVFGKKKCFDIKWIRKGSELRCRVPAYRGGRRSVKIVVWRESRNMSSHFGSAPSYEYIGGSW